MTNNNFDDEDLSELDADYSPLTPDKIKEKIPFFSKEKLCEIIVCDRYFGSRKELAIMCMEELAQRRINGEVFDFESYIEKSLKDFPKLEVIPDISNVLKQFVSGRTKQ